jgi:hypothetical protein
LNHIATVDTKSADRLPFITPFTTPFEVYILMFASSRSKAFDVKKDNSSRNRSLIILNFYRRSFFVFLKHALACDRRYPPVARETQI